MSEEDNLSVRSRRSRRNSEGVDENIPSSRRKRRLQDEPPTYNEGALETDNCEATHGNLCFFKCLVLQSITNDPSPRNYTIPKRPKENFQNLISPKNGFSSNMSRHPVSFNLWPNELL